VNQKQEGRWSVTLLMWLFWLGLVISAVLVVRYMFSADRRAEGLPRPPSVYQNIGGVDDFQLGPTYLRDGIWIVKSSEFIDAVQSDSSCPLHMAGQRLVDCRNQVYSVRGDPTNYFAGPEIPTGLQKLCTWVYPPQGDVYVYFGRHSEGELCPR
jgi:hypothetical protein